MQKILLLGNTGKVGTALEKVLSENYIVKGYNRSNFNPESCQIAEIIQDEKPNYVINCIAKLGINDCESNMMEAITINTRLPKFLAELTNEHGFTLVHFSTECVFSGRRHKGLNMCYSEYDAPDPVNIYGITKYAADCLIQVMAKKYFIFRLPVVFGDSIKGGQFLERMFDKLKKGETVRVADDKHTSPTYNMDIANKIKAILANNEIPYGLYNITNIGVASLYDLVSEANEHMGYEGKVEKASYKDFTSIGLESLYTPLSSTKDYVRGMRTWHSALKEYCMRLKEAEHGEETTGTL